MRKMVPSALLFTASLLAGLVPAIAQTNDPNAAAAAARARQAEINRQNEAAAAKVRAEQAAINRRNEEAARARNAAAARAATTKPTTPSPLAGAAPAPRNAPSARRQLEATPRDPNHNFDGRKPLPGPVRADPANKPSQVGTPTSAFKPKPVPSTGSDLARMRTNPPPKPTPSPGVVRSTSPVTTGATPIARPTGATPAPRPAVAPAAAPRPAPAAVQKPAPAPAAKPAEEKKKS